MCSIKVTTTGLLYHKTKEKRWLAALLFFYFSSFGFSGFGSLTRMPL